MPTKRPSLASEWMVDLREMADPMIPHNWESRAPTTRKAIDHIEAQEKEIARLTDLNASLNEQNVSLAEDNVRLQAALLKRTEQAEAEVSFERERNANNVACAETEREDLCKQAEQYRVQLVRCLTAAQGATQDPAKRDSYGWSPAYQVVLDLRRRLDGLVEAADNVTKHYPYLVYVDKLKDVLAIARDEKEE